MSCELALLIREAEEQGRPIPDSLPELEYGDGMTKQSFKDACDINKILKRAQRTGSLAHVQKYDQAVYADFHGYDLLEAHEMINRAHGIFNDLPSEVRNEFGNDAFKFAAFASDPANIGRLAELLPAIAEPGSFFPNPVKRQADAPEPASERAGASKGASERSPSAAEGSGESSASEGAASSAT